MVRITQDLVRKKAEHNECIIGTLEELSLHQEDVEKIEHLNNWCKDLQILYLQSNLISKIENLNKLKKLQYLNLAINNIETVENLERCESLEKLDLTLNFIGNIESVCSLKSNVHLKYLFLTGNPCCDFEGYREYVVVKLPQLEELDCKAISKSERIKAVQNISAIEKKILQAQKNYELCRLRQKERAKNCDQSGLTDEEFWKSPSEHCPEIRIEMSQRQRASRGLDEKPQTIKKQIKLLNKDGRPLNVNQAKLAFTFSDENPAEYALDVAVYKYLDTNLIEVDLQPTYVTIKVKGKIFQMVFPREIFIERSTCQRSQTTGHLVLKMPLIDYEPRKIGAEAKTVKKVNTETTKPEKPRREFLEVQEKRNELNIVNEQARKTFEDNLEVPPLEYI